MQGVALNDSYDKKRWTILNVAQEYQIQRFPTDTGYLTFIFSPTMLIVSHRFRLMEECMYGLSLIRLGMFIALAIIASTAIGLFTYMVVTVLAE